MKEADVVVKSVETVVGVTGTMTLIGANAVSRISVAVIDELYKVLDSIIRQPRTKTGISPRQTDVDIVAALVKRVGNMQKEGHRFYEVVNDLQLIDAVKEGESLSVIECNKGADSWALYSAARMQNYNISLSPFQPKEKANCFIIRAKDEDILTRYRDAAVDLARAGITDKFMGQSDCVATSDKHLCELYPDATAMQKMSNLSMDEMRYITNQITYMNIAERAETAQRGEEEHLITYGLTRDRTGQNTITFAEKDMDTVLKLHAEYGLRLYDNRGLETEFWQEQNVSSVSENLGDVINEMFVTGETYPVGGVIVDASNPRTRIIMGNRGDITVSEPDGTEDKISRYPSMTGEAREHLMNIVHRMDAPRTFLPDKASELDKVISDIDKAANKGKMAKYVSSRSLHYETNVIFSSYERLHHLEGIKIQKDEDGHIEDVSLSSITKSTDQIGTKEYGGALDIFGFVAPESASFIQGDKEEDKIEEQSLVSKTAMLLKEDKSHDIENEATRLLKIEQDKIDFVNDFLSQSPVKLQSYLHEPAMFSQDKVNNEQQRHDLEFADILPEFYKDDM